MVTLDDVKTELEALLEEEDRPIATAPELAERLDQSRRKTLDDLRLLERNGELKSHQVGAKARVWWIVEGRETRETTSPEQTGQHTEATNEPQETRESKPEPAQESTLPLRDASPELSQLLKDVLKEWRPGRSGDDRTKRRRIGREALVWLHDRREPASRSEFINALYEDTHLEGQGQKSWWDRLVREALHTAQEAGIVEYHDGVKEYEWVGQNDNNDGVGVYDPTQEFE